MIHSTGIGRDKISATEYARRPVPARLTLQTNTARCEICISRSCYRKVRAFQTLPRRSSSFFEFLNTRSKSLRATSGLCCRFIRPGLHPYDERMKPAAACEHLRGQPAELPELGDHVRLIGGFRAGLG